jgi:predicted transcriptional regulator
MVVVTVRLPDEFAADLESLAVATDRSKAYVAGQAIKEYLRREAAFVASVRKGMAEAERGEFATDQEIAAVFDKYRVKAKKRPRE